MDTKKLLNEAADLLEAALGDFYVPHSEDCQGWDSDDDDQCPFKKPHDDIVAWLRQVRPSSGYVLCAGD